MIKMQYQVTNVVSKDNKGLPSKIKYKERLKPSDRRTLWISRVVIWVSLIVLLFPVLWIVGASFGKGNSFFQGSVFPKELTLENYKILFTPTADLNFGRSLLNSLYVCTGVSIIQLLMTGTAAYAFSRMRFAGRKYGLMALLIIQMFPGSMTIAAVYTMLYSFHALDKLWALILFLAGGSAFNIWILKGNLDSIPKEIDEAAAIDGASTWQIFTKIILPLATPMFAVIFLFTFIGTYSEFMLSSAALQSTSKYTVAIALQSFINQKFNQHWTEFAAASVVASLPLMILFMALQKYIQSGLVAGSMGNE